MILRLLADLIGLLALAVVPRRSIEAENLVLRRQLAKYCDPRGESEGEFDLRARNRNGTARVLRLADPGVGGACTCDSQMLGDTLQRRKFIARWDLVCRIPRRNVKSSR